METFVNPERSLWTHLCERPSSYNPEVKANVEAILAQVRNGGDEALKALALKFDGYVPDCLEVTPEEKQQASEMVGPEIKEAIRTAAANIREFHIAQMPKVVSVETVPGVMCIQRPVPISRVGLYIPGGTAPLFSTVLMLAIPAQIAGCPEVILCTPAGKDGKVNPYVLWAADYCGVGRVFKLGGSQAIAAMAYGTASVPRVDKIFGPGNQYVTTAKQLLAGREVAIDMPAGPSEVMVIADAESNPVYVASDLLSQAEHGRDSQAMLVTTDPSLPQKVQAELERQIKMLDRGEYILSSLSKSRTIVLSSTEEVIEFANIYAPEHLIVSTSAPWFIADRIATAGSVFVGQWSPESAGDYASGTNHTLPTCGWGRSFSGVNIDSYMRKMTIQELSREGLARLSETIVAMAEAEGLQAHANAVKLRMDE